MMGFVLVLAAVNLWLLFFDQSEDFRSICFTFVDDVDDVCCSSQCECVDSGDMFCPLSPSPLVECTTIAFALICSCGNLRLA
jgi:hypothetical protein